MTQRIVISSQKGGVGKTTIALNLSLALAERRWRTLLVDLDPQGAIGLSLAKPDREWIGVTELLMGSAMADECLVRTHEENLSLLPRGRLDPLDVGEFERALATPGVLGRLLDDVERSFDVVLLDTPAGLGSIARGALAAAHHVLVPYQAAPLSMRSIGQVLRVIEAVQANENPELRLLGLLPSMVELTADASQAAMVELWTGFASVLETSIPSSRVFAEASMRGVPVGYLGGAVAPEVRRFGMLAMELESIIPELRKEVPDAHRPQRALV